MKLNQFNLSCRVTRLAASIALLLMAGALCYCAHLNTGCKPTLDTHALDDSTDNQTPINDSYTKRIPSHHARRMRKKDLELRKQAELERVSHKAALEATFLNNADSI